MPPVVVAAGIGAAGAIGGGLLASSASKKAANKAADSSEAVARENNALSREIYNQNYGILNPYAQRGNEAGSAINALLGISGTLPAAAPVAGTPAPGTGPLPTTPTTGGGTGLAGPLAGIRRRIWEARIARGDVDPEDAPPWIRNALGIPSPTTTPPINGTTPTTANPATPLSTYQDAFQNYLNSTGYQFRVGEGNKAITQGYAGRGSLQSGAALKALQTYGQNTATDFFKDYLGLLANQQGVGLSGASAIAGVGQNYVNSVSANNNAAGTAAANAALAAGNANANLWGTIGGAIGGVANAWGSSYRPPGG